MDSLAKQSLLAAQVLNLIPTQKARERYIFLLRKLSGVIIIRRLTTEFSLGIFFTVESPPIPYSDQWSLRKYCLIGN